eukprot:CAMPEP_0197515468 /NCGR_PEP_ID=MMETSP1318-20131121/598_1 /TAXON_ID=552666 /ORGANISM="Partenskyella glossopodia, Strain RCC365" /LENGTH=86 /DNA_ID=CAMNT_0043063857 /DNA_START=247 /DNA_END=507 /DNA_ORIENTATION=-
MADKLTSEAAGNPNNTETFTIPLKPVGERGKASTGVVKSRGLVPRQVGKKRANVSTEDVEAWTTLKRLKAQRIAEAKHTKEAASSK